MRPETALREGIEAPPGRAAAARGSSPPFWNSAMQGRHALFRKEYIMPGRLIDLLIVHPLERPRDELIRLLSHAEGIGSVSGLGDIANAGDRRAGIVIVRPTLPLTDQGDALRAWSLKTGHPKLVALLAAAEADAIPQLYRLGFSGFLRTDAGIAEFLAALRTLRQGDVYLSGELADGAFMGERESRLASMPVGLTGREQEVLRLIAVNMSNKDIARRLHLSVRTVETHRFHIRKKTKAGNWRELAVVAERLGLLAGYDHYSGGAERIVAPAFHED